MNSIPDTTLALLCLSYLTELSQRITKNPNSPESLSTISSPTALNNSVTALKEALGLNTDSSPSHMLYLSAGLSTSTTVNPDGGVSDGTKEGAKTDTPYHGGVPLQALVGKGAKALDAKIRHVADEELTNLQLFKNYLQAVTGKGYFEGAGEEGGEEWTTRMEKIKEKFRRKMWDKRQTEGEAASVSSVPSSSATPDYTPTPTPTSSTPEILTVEPEDPSITAKADEEKALGNKALQSKEYKKAAQHYTQALKISPRGPQSHIYNSNRSAAYCYLGRYDKAEMDAERCIGLNPEYAKGWGRLGLCRLELEDYDGAKEAYERALKEDKGMKGVKEQLKRIEKIKKAKGKGPSSSGKSAGGLDLDAGAGGMGGMSQQDMMAQMMGGGGPGGSAGGLAGLMNNPAMMKMAQQMMSNPAAVQQAQQMMMQNPQMAQMAQQMMSDPKAMENMMGMFGGK